MAMYMVQFSYADQAWAALTQHPQDYTIPSRDLIEKLGGKMIQMYYCFGEYNGLMIFEAPDDISASAVSLSSLAAGHLKVNKITKLFTADEMVLAIRKAGEIGISRPESVAGHRNASCPFRLKGERFCNRFDLRFKNDQRLFIQCLSFAPRVFVLGHL